MDWKKFFTVLVLAAALALIFNLIFGKMFGPPPVASSGHSHKIRSGFLVTNSHRGLPVKPQIITIGGDKPSSPYLLQLTLSNHTAGVIKVSLNAKNYRESSNSAKPLVLLHHLDQNPSAFAVSRMVINGQNYFLRDMNWDIEPVSPKEKGGVATFAFTLNVPGKHEKMLRFIREYQVKPGSYNVTIHQRIENLTAGPLDVKLVEYGPTNLPNHDKQVDQRVFQCCGYNTKGRYVTTSGFPEIYQTALLNANTPPHTLGEFHGKNRLLWIASSNRFFTAIMRPLPWGHVRYDLLDDGSKLPRVDSWGKAVLRRVGPEASAANPRGATAVITSTRTLQLTGHAVTGLPLTVYFGPKKRSILAGNSKAPADSMAAAFSMYQYINIIQFDQGSPCAFLTFSWLALGIMKLLTWIDYVVHNYGLAIMVLVIAVRILLHPLTRVSQVSMARSQRKMGALAPEMKLLKEKYGKDRAKLNQEMMALYSKHGVNPAGTVLGCLPMLLQMPIWIALYSGLAVDIDLRQASFIPGWINDLANPDSIAVFHTPFHVPILGYIYHGQSFMALNLLPILLGIVFFFQMRFQMRLAPTPTDPQQKQAQAISQYMILILPIVLYNAPSGLNLYICASTLGGLLDMWLVRRHIKKLEAAGKMPQR